MRKRVVVTGMGVVASNATGIDSFLRAIRCGKSGIKFLPQLNEFKFACNVGGVPDISKTKYSDIINQNEYTEADISIIYAIIAGLEAWEKAKFLIPNTNSEINSDAGAIIGTCFSGIEIFIRKIYPLISSGNTRKLGSQVSEHWMSSGSAAALSRILALANQTTANSSACSTGTEAIVMAYDRIKSGKAKLMLAGGTESYSPYAWAGFDSMRLLARKYNNTPEKASRPMSNSANGFVASAGAGILVLEDLENALNRNATIYAEIIGAEVNSGTQRNGGSMTATNPKQAENCIKAALCQANIKGEQIDLISGHLTGTKADVKEIEIWKNALDISNKYPFINAPKSIIGHMIGAAGAVETIAAVLQLSQNFIHPSINCEDLNPEIEKIWDVNKIPHKTLNNVNINYVAKAGFGFGDVNSCLILKKYK